MQNTLTLKPDSVPLPKLREPGKKDLELFSACLKPLTKTCRPPLDQDQVVGYFNALADLPGAAIFAAASELVASRTYPTWPSPGEIRQSAARIVAPQVTPGEAWALAKRAAMELCDPAMDYKNGMPASEWNEHIWENLPPAVAVTLRIFGGRNLPSSENTYARFRDEYERQVLALRRPLMIPAAAKPIIEQYRKSAAKLGGLLAGEATKRIAEIETP